MQYLLAFDHLFNLRQLFSSGAFTLQFSKILNIVCFHISQFIRFIHEIQIWKHSPHIYGSLKTTTRLNDVFKSPQHEAWTPLDQIKYYTNLHFYKTSHASTHNTCVCVCVCVSQGRYLTSAVYTFMCKRSPVFHRQWYSPKSFDKYLHVPSSIKRFHAEFSTALSTGAQFGEKPISYQLTPDIQIMWYLCSFWYLLV